MAAFRLCRTCASNFLPLPPGSKRPRTWPRCKPSMPTCRPPAICAMTWTCAPLMPTTSPPCELDDAKRVLMDCLDANHLYVNLNSLGDADFDISTKTPARPAPSMGWTNEPDAWPKSLTRWPSTGRSRLDIPDDITGNLAPQIEVAPLSAHGAGTLAVLHRQVSGPAQGPAPAVPHGHGQRQDGADGGTDPDLYRRGYRNFLFFVNSTQIIEKTKDNFLNPASAKHLFAPSVRIDDKPVDIRAVDTFDAVKDGRDQHPLHHHSGAAHPDAGPERERCHHRGFPRLQGGDDFGRGAPPERRDQERTS